MCVSYASVKASSYPWVISGYIHMCELRSASVYVHVYQPMSVSLFSCILAISLSVNPCLCVNNGHVSMCLCVSAHVIMYQSVSTCANSIHVCQQCSCHVHIWVCVYVCQPSSMCVSPCPCLSTMSMPAMLMCVTPYICVSLCPCVLASPCAYVSVRHVSVYESAHNPECISDYIHVWSVCVHVYQPMSCHHVHACLCPYMSYSCMCFTCVHSCVYMGLCVCMSSHI